MREGKCIQIHWFLEKQSRRWKRWES